MIFRVMLDWRNGNKEYYVRARDIYSCIEKVTKRHNRRIHAHGGDSNYLIENIVMLENDDEAECIN